MTPYRAELETPFLPVASGAGGLAVQRIQEWLGLHGIGVEIDGDFGPATARAVGQFQRNAGIGVPRTDGAVDLPTWQALVAPLAKASIVAPRASFGGTVVALAQNWLAARAREVGGDNRGPFVRHLCRGPEVPWCQGFASTLYDDAARLLGQASPLELVLDGIWCLFVPRMVQEARRAGRFAVGSDTAAPHKPGAGSMFFLRGGPYGYLHVGIVEMAHDDGTMTTIEGNTNEDGSANGYEVARRVRRIASSDFGLVQP